MVNQCKMMLSSIEVFRTGMKMAANQDNGITDRNEDRMMKDIEKELDKLKSKIEQYI